MFADYLDLRQPLVQQRPRALSPARCAEYIDRFHANSAELAPIVGPGGEKIDLSLRNNTRIMWDDEDEAAELLSFVADTVPHSFRGSPLVGANERLRVYRYAPGEKQSAHWDTEVEFEERTSRVTLVFYLNEDFEGGHTNFPELDQRVVPGTGDALIFQHRVLHVAEPVTSGVKYVLRTDLFYAS